MGYCPENLKFSLSYTLHSNFKRDGDQFAACDNTYPGGSNQFRNFVLHYAGPGPFSSDNGTTNTDHFWTGEYRLYQASGLLGQTLHYLYLNSEGDYGLHIEDHNDPLIQNSFPPYSGNVGSETVIPEIIFGACSKDSDGNLLSSCVGPSTNTDRWFEGLLIDESLVVTGADIICRQYISPTITQIGNCDGEPSPQCTSSNGSFSITRGITTCDNNASQAEARFDSLVPAGATNISRTTTSKSTRAKDGEISVDILINKNLFDITPLREALRRLIAKQQHYQEIFSCGAESIDSVATFHAKVYPEGEWEVGNSAYHFGRRNDAAFLPPSFLSRFKIVNPPTTDLATRPPNSSSFYYAIHSQKALVKSALNKFGSSEASHIFLVDPDDDAAIHHFPIPYLGNEDEQGEFRSRYNANAVPRGAGKRYESDFKQALFKFMKRTAVKIQKIEKFLEENLSSCSKIANMRANLGAAAYVFEGLTYSIEISYDEIAYGYDDCAAAKTIISTIPKTKVVSAQTFDIDEITTIEIT